MFQKSSLFAVIATMAFIMPIETRSEELVVQQLRRTTTSTSRSLSYEFIAGFEPSSIVTDHVSTGSTRINVAVHKKTT